MSGAGWIAPCVSIAREATVWRPARACPSRRSRSSTPRPWIGPRESRGRRRKPGAAGRRRWRPRPGRWVHPCDADDPVRARGPLDFPGDLGGCGLQAVGANVLEGPRGVARRVGVLAERDVVAGHEPAGVPVVDQLDPLEPLDVRHAIPAGGDEADREAVLDRKWLAVHLVAEEVALRHRGLDGHASGELLGDGDVPAAGDVGVRCRGSGARCGWADDARVVADRDGAWWRTRTPPRWRT